jgi:hypothetical protein
MYFSPIQDQGENLEKTRSILFEHITHLQSPVEIKIVQGKDREEKTLNATADFDLLVLGDFKTNNLYEKLFGTFHDSLISKSACNVLCIQKYGTYQTLTRIKNES